MVQRGSQAVHHTDTICVFRVHLPSSALTFLALIALIIANEPKSPGLARTEETAAVAQGRPRAVERGPRHEGARYGAIARP
jgi:hypothetical protein